MIYGRLDAITSSGYVEGWAYDDDDVLSPLTVSVTSGDREHARGLANIYRWDLVEAGCGTGWCAFRLKLIALPPQGQAPEFILHDTRTQNIIHRMLFLQMVEDRDGQVAAIADLIVTDPTSFVPIEQLRGCGRVFDSYLSAEGQERFVRAAYIYILQRPADSAGLAFYSAALRDGSITPYDLLKVLHDSDEFGSSPHPLVAPSDPGFVFRQA